MDNCFISSRLVLKLLNLKHTDQYLQDCLLSHPDHPSLLCIADTMEKYGVKTNAVKIDKPDFKNNNRSIPLESITDTGDCLDSEVINTISVHSDSSSLIGTKILVSDMGWNLGHEIKRNIKLIT